ncbi:MAG: sensor histidine kinase [Actinomycetes bacterium]
MTIHPDTDRPADAGATALARGVRRGRTGIVLLLASIGLLEATGVVVGTDGDVPLLLTAAIVGPLLAANVVSVLAERRGRGDAPSTVRAEIALDAAAAVVSGSFGAAMFGAIAVPPILLLVSAAVAMRRPVWPGVLVSLGAGATIATLRLAGVTPTATSAGGPVVATLLLVGVPGLLAALVGALALGRERLLADVRASHAALAARGAELDATNTRLVEANRGLERFASIVAHDLRTPLTTITGYAELLQLRDDLPEPARTFVDRIHEGARRAEELVVTLLRHARTVATDPDDVPVDLDSAVADALDDLASTVEQRGGEVVVEPLGWAQGDPVLLRQVLQNLLANALCYHRLGQAPRVHVHVLRRDGATVELAVDDDGVGIPEEDREHVLEFGTRLRSVEADGSGVGLATCVLALGRIGGGLVVEASPSGGARMRLDLRASSAPGTTAGVRSARGAG